MTLKGRSRSRCGWGVTWVGTSSTGICGIGPPKASMVICRLFCMGCGVGRVLLSGPRGEAGEMSGMRHRQGHIQVLPGRRRIQEPAAPELEGDEGPQLQVQVAAAIVHLQELRHIAAIEYLLARATGGQQQVPGKTAEAAAEPGTQWHGEAVF